MTKPLATRIKKTYTPKRMVGTLQTSFMVALMRAKGFVSQEYILSIITALSTTTNFSDITFDEAQYIIKRLPNISRKQIDAFWANEATANDIGLPAYYPPRQPSGNFTRGGGKA